MIKIRLESYFLHELIALFAQELKSGYQVHREHAMLTIKSPYYTSHGRAMDFSHGLGHFYLDIQLEEDLEILFDIERYHPLRFLYCLQGEFFHSGLSGTLTHHVKAGQYIAYACTRGREQRIRFSAGKATKCIGIQLIRHDFIRAHDVSRLPSEIRAIVKDTHAEQPYLMHSTYSDAISMCLATPTINAPPGFAGDLLFEAKALEILGRQIGEYAQGEESTRSNGN